LICPSTIVEYDYNPEVATHLDETFERYFVFHPFVQTPIDILSLNAAIFFHPWLDGSSSDSVEYDNTLAVLSVWSDSRGFGKEW
jgi:hypothetical protein